MSGPLVLNLETQPEEVELVNSWLSGLQYVLASAGSSIVLAETNHDEMSNSNSPVPEEPVQPLGAVANGAAAASVAATGSMSFGVVAQAMATMAQATGKGMTSRHA